MPMQRMLMIAPAPASVAGQKKSDTVFGQQDAWLGTIDTAPADGTADGC